VYRLSRFFSEKGARMGQTLTLIEALQSHGTIDDRTAWMRKATLVRVDRSTGKRQIVLDNEASVKACAAYLDMPMADAIALLRDGTLLATNMSYVRQPWAGELSELRGRAG
jgi:hypothetical protein